jgi:hypothetical protein
MMNLDNFDDREKLLLIAVGQTLTLFATPEAVIACEIW